MGTMFCARDQGPAWTRPGMNRHPAGSRMGHGRVRNSKTPPPKHHEGSDLGAKKVGEKCSSFFYMSRPSTVCPCLPDFRDDEDDDEHIMARVPARLARESMDCAAAFTLSDLLSRSLVMLSTGTAFVLFQWPDLGINFRVSMLEDLSFAYRVTRFDRTRPAEDLVPPSVTLFHERRVAVHALITAWHGQTSSRQ